MKALLIAFIVCLSLVAADAAASKPDNDPYAFNWKSAKDMSGAFMMCGLTGFVIGDDCPKVLWKCMTDRDLLKFKLFGVRSKCLDLFAFFTSGEEAKEALDHANGQIGSNNRDHDRHKNSANHYEQVNDQEVSRELYRDTKYYGADLAAENLINEDAEQYYYFGDGRGNGGWGRLDYQKQRFVDEIYKGESPDDAYNRAYAEVMFDDFICGDDDEVPRALDTESKGFGDCEFMEERARQAGEEAREQAIADMESAYSEYREEMGWNDLEHGRAELEGNYNTDRLTAYYHAYLEALDGVCGGNEDCAKAKAKEKVNEMDLTNP